MEEIDGEDAKEIAGAYGWPFDGSGDDEMFVHVENAAEWQEAFLIAQLRLRDWAALESECDYPGMNKYLERYFNFVMGGSLAYQVEVEF